MTTPPGDPPNERWRPWLGTALLVLGCGTVVAVTFWLLDLYLGDMPSPLAGFLAGGGLALVSALHARRDRSSGR